MDMSPMQVELKEYLENIIQLKFENQKELINQYNIASDKALSIFTLNNEVHLHKLNNTYDFIKDTVETKLTKSEYDIKHKELIRRLEILENKTFEHKGETRVTDMVKLFIASLIGSGIAIIADYLINHL